MKYEDKFQKYLEGQLEKDEEVQIEEDIAKAQVLMDYIDSQADEMLFEAEDISEKKGGSKEGLSRSISRAVNRKLRHYAAATGAIVLIAVFIIIQVLSPVLDRIFYNPGSDQGDFDLSIGVYMELFCGDKGFAGARVRPEGYGKYSLDIETQINGQIEHHFLELNKSHLYWTDMSWNQPDLPGNAFTYCVGDKEICCGIEKEQAVEKLQELPDSMRIRSAVSFDELKDMDGIRQFIQTYDGEYLYVPIVSSPDQKGSMSGYMGFRPDGAGYVRTDSYDQKKYPYLDMAQYEGEDAVAPSDILEQHVKSMLTYLKDQERFCKIFDSPVPGENVFDLYKYESALKYIEENGVYGYGIVVNATKDELIEMLSDPAIDSVYLMDSYLDLAG